MKNEISVVIVTYNSAKTIKECLDSIVDYEPNSEIVVVDNNSQDHTLEIVKKYKSVYLIANDQNLGFSKANNIGAAHATGEYLVFLNPDCKLLEKGSLTTLVNRITENASYGLIGPKIMHADGTLQRTVRHFPTVMRAFQEFVLWQKGAYEFYDPGTHTLVEVETIVGACMVVSRALFDKIKGWNERYFLYFEDIDLCQKVRDVGLKVGYDPTVTICHIEGVSGGGSEKTRQLALQSSRLYFGIIKHETISLIGRIGNKLHGYGN